MIYLPKYYVCLLFPLPLLRYMVGTISLSIFLQEFDTVKKIEKLQILSEK